MPQPAKTSMTCATHGPCDPAVVCQHLIGATDKPRGFVDNSPSADDLQAWCSACEDMFLAEGSMTESFKSFNAFQVVCTACYADIKARHAATT